MSPPQGAFIFYFLLPDWTAEISYKYSVYFSPPTKKKKKNSNSNNQKESAELRKTILGYFSDCEAMTSHSSSAGTSFRLLKASNGWTCQMSPMPDLLQVHQVPTRQWRYTYKNVRRIHDVNSLTRLCPQALSWIVATLVFWGMIFSLNFLDSGDGTTFLSLFFLFPLVGAILVTCCIPHVEKKEQLKIFASWKRFVHEQKPLYESYGIGINDLATRTTHHVNIDGVEFFSLLENNGITRTTARPSEAANETMSNPLLCLSQGQPEICQAATVPSNNNHYTTMTSCPDIPTVEASQAAVLNPNNHDMMPSTSSCKGFSSRLVQDLEALQRMRERGILSEEEFQMAKAQILTTTNNISPNNGTLSQEAAERESLVPASFLCAETPSPSYHQEEQLTEMVAMVRAVPISDPLNP